ncbi:MAG: group III truncated hemoglobin [Salibacteraceae bacterium]
MKQDISNREDIILMVNSFYEELQKDEELNHMFNVVAKLDWDSHMPKMYDFWETIIFKNAVYSGNPMRVHKNLHGLQHFTKSMFTSWLAIFNENMDNLFAGKNAEEAKVRALSIATMIQLKTIYAN